MQLLSQSLGKDPHLTGVSDNLTTPACLGLMIKPRENRMEDKKTESEHDRQGHVQRSLHSWFAESGNCLSWETFQFILVQLGSVKSKIVHNFLGTVPLFTEQPGSILLWYGPTGMLSHNKKGAWVLTCKERCTLLAKIELLQFPQVKCFFRSVSPF